tara:strand:+ start:1287 stop:1562 length:276 start_codon:yes stop_codon:yes gene_type:complete
MQIKEINSQLEKIGKEIAENLPTSQKAEYCYAAPKKLVRLAVRCIEQQEYSSDKNYDGEWIQHKFLRFDVSRNDELFALVKKYKAANFDFS